MDKLYFLSGETYNANILKVSNHIIRITFDEEIPEESIILSGFDIINEHNDKNMSNDYYHSYNTLYLTVDENTVMLSNDNSVYVAPDNTGTDEDIIIESHIPTLTEAKQLKINELSSICNTLIVNGVDIEIDGETEHFSYNDEDQVNIKEIFDLAVQTNVPMYYHADGESCKLYTVEQIIDLYATTTTNKMHHTTYFNQIKLYVNTLETTDEVNAIEYGQELTGEYLDTYNASMTQAHLVLESLLTKRAELSEA